MRKQIPTSRSLTSHALVFWLIIIGARAEAQECLIVEQCKALLERGQRASKAQDYREALSIFEAAYTLVPDPLLLFNIGRAHYRLSHPDQALEYYQRFQVATPNPDPELARTLERYKAEAQEAAALKNVTPEPTLRAPVLKEPSPDKPVYKKWWFWTILGGVTVAAGTGLALGLILRPQTVPIPEGYTPLEGRTFGLIRELP